MIELDVSSSLNGFTSQERQLARFVMEYFKAIDVPYTWEERVLAAQLDKDQASFLAGSLSNPATLRLVFRAKDAENYPDAELICPGSFRLDQMVDSVTKRGRITCQFGYTDSDLMRTGPIAFIPYLFLVCQISFLGPTYQKEQCIEVGCDLVNGTIVPNPYRHLVSLYRCRVPPFPAVRHKRKISFKKAFLERIGGYIIRKLERGDHRWAQAASTHLQLESEEVNRYFQSLETIDGPDGEGRDGRQLERSLRLKEAVRRNTPQVIVRPLTGAIVYLSESVGLT